MGRSETQLSEKEEKKGCGGVQSVGLDSAFLRLIGDLRGPRDSSNRQGWTPGRDDGCMKFVSCVGVIERFKIRR